LNLSNRIGQHGVDEALLLDSRVDPVSGHEVTQHFPSALGLATVGIAKVADYALTLELSDSDAEVFL